MACYEWGRLLGVHEKDGVELTRCRVEEWDGKGVKRELKL